MTALILAKEMVQRGKKIALIGIHDHSVTDSLIANHGCTITGCGAELFVESKSRAGILELVMDIKPVILECIEEVGIISGPHHAAYLAKKKSTSFNPMFFGVMPIVQALSELKFSGKIQKLNGELDRKGAYASMSYSGKKPTMSQCLTDDFYFAISISREVEENRPLSVDGIEDIGGNRHVIDAINEGLSSDKLSDVDRYVLNTLLNRANELSKS